MMKIIEGIRPDKWKWGTRLIACVLLAVGTLGAHPFYLSVTDIEYFPDERVLGMTMKVYTDDLEAVLEDLGSETLRLGSAEEANEADQVIARYLDRVIRWTMDAEPVTMIWLGKEVEGEVTYLYLESEMAAMPEKIEVSHGLFLDYLETQENIVHLHCGDRLVSERLNERNPIGELECNAP